MRLIKIFISLIIVSSLTMMSCEKKNVKPLEDCVYAAIDRQNIFENMHHTLNTIDACDKSIYDNAPKSLSVPTGSWIRIIAAWCFENYKDEDVKVSKIYVKTTANNQTIECELLSFNNIGYSYQYFSAYSNTTYYVRFVLNNGEEHTVGPFSVSVNNDNKTLFYTEHQTNTYGALLINTNNNSDKIGSYYLFSPYTRNGYSGGSGGALFIADLNSDINKIHNLDFSPQFGLFCLTKDGTNADEVKLVAADKINAKGLYPELTTKFGCDLGFNYARFVPWPVTLDSTNCPGVGVTNFECAFNKIADLLTYNDLDTMNLSNSQEELVVSKIQPGFKFITNSGKKGIGVVLIGDKNSRIYFKMQR